MTSPVASEEHTRGGRSGRPASVFRGAWVYTGALALALATGAALFAERSPSQVQGTLLLVLVGMGVLAELLRTDRFSQGTSVSFTAIVLAAAVALTGPLGAALVGLVTPWAKRGRQPLVSRTFTAVMNGVLGFSGGLTYLALGGALAPGPDASTRQLLVDVLLPLVAANVVMLVLNAPLVAGVIWLTTRAPLSVSAVEVVRAGALTYLGHGLVAFLFVVLWQVEGLGPVSLLLAISPLALAQWSIAQQSAEREAHLRTVSTLVAAVEARDPSTRGSSGRVASVSTAIAQELRLRPRQVEALQFAAALHNVGLVAPVARESRARGHLSAAEVERILNHPRRGVEMLRHIDFLEESTAAVQSHHEWWDGRGYPDGLSGDRIPLLARVIATADTYVALLRSTSTPHAALTALEGRAGTHLDPRCTAALARAHSHGRVNLAPVSDADGPRDLEHDDPAVCDLLAGNVARSPAGGGA